MHSSGPRPKSHCGSPAMTSSPTFVGLPQFRCAVPLVELPLGWQRTLSVWFTRPGVLPLLNTTARSPFGSGAGSDPWSKLHEFGFSWLLNAFPRVQSGDVPLICSGGDHVRAPSVDIEP